MSRLEELKNKGWVNLNKEEREEYKSLSETKDDVGVSAQESLTAASKPATVTMTTDELQRFVESEILKFKKIESEKNNFAGGVTRSEVEWKEWSEPKKRNKTATFRRYRADGDAPWGIIIDWRFYKKIFNEETRKVDKPVYKIIVLYDNGDKKEYEIEWGQFAAITDLETVEIINEDKKVLAMSQGTVNKAFMDSEGYVWGNHPDGQVKVKGEITTKVPLIVKRHEIICTVKRENGQVFTLNADRLNG